VAVVSCRLHRVSEVKMTLADDQFDWYFIDL